MKAQHKSLKTLLQGVITPSTRVTVESPLAFGGVLYSNLAEKNRFCLPVESSATLAQNYVVGTPK